MQFIILHTLVSLLTMRCKRLPRGAQLKKPGTGVRPGFLRNFCE